MASRNTEEGQLAWGRLSEASQVELFLGSRGEALCSTDFDTKRHDGASPPRREDVAIVSGRVITLDYDM
jgi:hypothetical protein